MELAATSQKYRCRPPAPRPALFCAGRPFPAPYPRAARGGIGRGMRAAGKPRKRRRKKSAEKCGRQRAG